MILGNLTPVSCRVKDSEKVGTDLPCRQKISGFFFSLLFKNILEVCFKAKGSASAFFYSYELHNRQFHICNLIGKFEVEK